MTQLPFGCLLYVSLLYAVWMCKILKRNRAQFVVLGRRRMKRMQRCAPQCLQRQLEYQKRRALCTGEMTARLTGVAQYVFFFYQGVHATHCSSWLQAAFAIHCKAHGWHADTAQGCYFASCLSMVSMAQGHVVGPFLGAALALAAPFLMPTNTVLDHEYSSVNILSEEQLRRLCSGGPVSSAETVVHVHDTDVPHSDAGAQVSLADVFAEVGITEADLVPLIADGSLAEDALEILRDSECRNVQQLLTSQSFRNSTSSAQVLQPTPAVEADVVANSAASSSHSNTSNPMSAVFFGESEPPPVPSISAQASVTQNAVNPMFAAIFGDDVPGVVANAWQKIPKRRDVAEGSNVEGVSTTAHPLDDLADAGKIRDDGSQSAEEDSLSEVSGDEEHSDDEDVFKMQASSQAHLSTAYQSFWLYRWQLAEEELCKKLRDEVLLPLASSDTSGTVVFTDVEKAVVLPPWHCPFHNCCVAETQLNASDKHEYKLWRHVWHDTAPNVSHAPLLRQIIVKYNLRQTVFPESRHLEEVAFALLSRAMLAKERELCPRLGLATDRRTLAHVGEVFREEEVKTLMCYVCACKHIAHEGVNKFGEPRQKGNIAMRRLGSSHRHLLADSGSTSWKYNLSAKYYKDRFGKATASALDLQAGCMEWKRHVQCKRGTEEVLCCPEDVMKSNACTHGEDMVCEKCFIPFCNTCWNLLRKDLKVPKALSNDNVIGYVASFFVEHRVTWLEATIAAPVFSGMVCYYVEGKPGDRHHMMESVLGKPERAYAVRGNLFSFLLPWEKIMVELCKKIEEGDLSQWPMDRGFAAQLCKVRFVHGLGLSEWQLRASSI